VFRGDAISLPAIYLTTSKQVKDLLGITGHTERILLKLPANKFFINFYFYSYKFTNLHGLLT